MIDFYFDFLSPYAYLAHQRLPQLAASFGHELAYHPVDLAWIKKKANNTGPATREMPLKLKYARADMQRWARKYGATLIPLVSYDSSRANRGVFYAMQRSAAGDYVARLWRDVYGQGGDMSSDDVLGNVAQSLGWDQADFLRFVASDEAAKLLDDSNESAHARGVFGVPTMQVGDDMWWGNDRLELMCETLAAARAA